MRSPFKPTAGRQPPVLVGRDRDIENFRMAIEEGPGAPERLLFVTGARGIGKTVMLNALSHVVQEQGWITVNETASSGFVSRIVQALQGERPKQISYTLPSASLEVPFAGAQATVGFGQVQVSTGLEPLDIRHAIGGRLDRLDEHKQGVLITLD